MYLTVEAGMYLFCRVLNNSLWLVCASLVLGMWVYHEFCFTDKRQIGRIKSAVHRHTARGVAELRFKPRIIQLGNPCPLHVTTGLSPGDVLWATESLS